MLHNHNLDIGRDVVGRDCESGRHGTGQVPVFGGEEDALRAVVLPALTSKALRYVTVADPLGPTLVKASRPGLVVRDPFFSRGEQGLEGVGHAQGIQTRDADKPAAKGIAITASQAGSPATTVPNATVAAISAARIRRSSGFGMPLAITPGGAPERGGSLRSLEARQMTGLPKARIESESSCSRGHRFETRRPVGQPARKGHRARHASLDG